MYLYSEVDCGEIVDGMMYTNGTITSPGFPDNYPAFLNCKYTIRAAPGTSKVHYQGQTSSLVASLSRKVSICSINS